MVNIASRVAIVTVLVLAVSYQFVFKQLIFGTLGHGRKVRSLKDFPNYNCEKIDVPGLEACEDMWLHEETGFLYMACSTSESRLSWLPAVEFLDASKRGGTDRIAMLDTRGKGPIESRLKWLTVENFPGNKGDGTFDLHGVSFLATARSNTLRILLVNHRPPFDPVTGAPLDASQVGANSTIEHFITEAGSSSIRYVRTHAHPLIDTPNSVAWVSDHSFVFTNDKSQKVGHRRQLDLVIGGGSVVYCDRNRCHSVVSDIKLPNGIVRARDGLIYVVYMIPGVIRVFSLTSERKFELEDIIEVGLPMDNLSMDSEGDIYAAAFPKVHKWIESSKDYRVAPPTAVFKISRDEKKKKNGVTKKHTAETYEGTYSVEKILEDDGSLLPGATSAIHDPRTGKVFLAGIMTPYVAVCERRA